MQYSVIGPAESPDQLSARVHRPVCMLLRANRLYSAGWLLPGREICIPGADFCRIDAGLCPLEALRIPAQHFERFDGDLPVPERLRKWSAVHEHAVLPQWRAGGRVAAIRPMESMAQFAARVGGEEGAIRRINIYYGRPVPGVQLLVY